MWLGLGWAAIFPAQTRAQIKAQNEEAQNEGQAPATDAGSASLATVHGLVRNGATGEPLARALVRVLGNADTGAMTDGEGRFEIAGIPAGAQEFEAVKPGYLDEAVESAGMGDGSREFAHNVIVAAGMPDVIFAMEPVNSLRGQIQLSTGEPAQGIGVTLLRQLIESGRTVWQMTNTARTNMDGVYRFGGLPDGTYAIYSDPAMESEPATNLVEPGSASKVARSGYASQFYPEARELAGAGRIQLRGGEQGTANLLLVLEPFHAVTATVQFPGNRAHEEASNSQAMVLTEMVTDGQGHQLPYTAQYDQTTHTVQALLPDGNYALVVTGAGPMIRLSGAMREAEMFSGSVEFAVAGHPIGNLRIGLGVARGSPVQVSMVNTNTRAISGTEGGDSVFITLTQTGGWIGDGMMSTYAQGPVMGPLEVTNFQPGSYWVHTNLSDKRVCEGSLTAGGANLAREPLVLGLNGPAAPLNLTLRDDCAELTISLPAAVAGSAMGEEPAYTVYVVPDFDSTQNVVPETLRPSTGGHITLGGMTPGTYHVYAFDKPMALAYHSAAALAASPNAGQPVELSPGATANLVLEVASQ